MVSAKVLLVDDELELLKDRSEIIERLGYDCVVASNGHEAISVIERENPDIILTDQNMPVQDGFAVLHAARSREIRIPVVIFTGYGTVEKAVDAMKGGAYDYVKKPLSPEKLEEVLKKTLEKTRLKRKSDSLRMEMTKNRHSGDLVYRSSRMKQIMINIVKLSHSNANVMIFGESGTGKELIARSIHKYSIRKGKPFIPLDCGALPATLLESELFGFEKGSFTGAAQAKTGIIELAAGGTLFLDEITELDVHLQAKLLRVIQERSFRRIGGKDLVKVNIRIISATNRIPEKAVLSGSLREDLFYRLNVVPIFLPPLRERTEDIPLLAHHFIDKYNPATLKPITGISEEALSALASYHWPGNVRELENVMQRVISLIEHDFVEASDLPKKILTAVEGNTSPGPGTHPYKQIKQEKVAQFGRAYVVDLLKENGGNVSLAARVSGLSRTTMYRMIKKYKIDKQQFQ